MSRGSCTKNCADDGIPSDPLLVQSSSSIKILT